MLYVTWTKRKITYFLFKSFCSIKKIVANSCSHKWLDKDVRRFIEGCIPITVCWGAKIIYDLNRLKINTIIKIGFFLGKHASQSGKVLFYDLFHRIQLEVRKKPTIPFWTHRKLENFLLNTQMFKLIFKVWTKN